MNLRFAQGGVAFAVVMVLIVSVLYTITSAAPTTGASSVSGKFPVTHTDAEYHKILTPAQYNVMRQAGTEEPYTGAYWNNHAKGVYVCPVDGQVLFSSDTKFDSGTGWPSFYQPYKSGAVITRSDSSFGMDRTEVICSKCGSHLGHVFNDGPAPTGLRYCMNSAALKFIPAKQ